MKLKFFCRGLPQEVETLANKFFEHLRINHIPDCCVFWDTEYVTDDDDIYFSVEVSYDEDSIECKRNFSDSRTFHAHLDRVWDAWDDETEEPVEVKPVYESTPWANPAPACEGDT